MASFVDKELEEGEVVDSELEEGEVVDSLDAECGTDQQQCIEVEPIKDGHSEDRPINIEEYKQMKTQALLEHRQGFQGWYGYKIHLKRLEDEREGILGELNYLMYVSKDQGEENEKRQERLRVQLERATSEQAYYIKHLPRLTYESKMRSRERQKEARRIYMASRPPKASRKVQKSNRGEVVQPAKACMLYNVTYVRGNFW